MISKRYVILTVIFLGTLPSLAAGYVLSQTLIDAQEKGFNQTLAKSHRANEITCRQTDNFRKKVEKANDGFIQHNDITASLFTNIAALSGDEIIREEFAKAVPVYEHITHFYTNIPKLKCSKHTRLRNNK